MKKISAVQLGFAFAGSFLGAGYVSGQEMWQFFGRFGGWGFPGLLVAMILVGSFGVMTMELARKTGIIEMDRLVVEKDIPLLRRAIGIMQMVMLFGFTVAMCAAGAALCNQQWGIPTVAASVVFSAAVAALSLMGMTGLVNAFSALVPLLSAVTILLGVTAVVRGGGVVIGTAEAASGSWLVSAVTFFAYNSFGVIGLLIPMGGMARDGRSVRRGVGLGCIILAAIALGALAAVGAVPGSETAEMPVLAVIAEYFPRLAPAYAVVLLLAIFCAAVSCLVAMTTFLEEKSDAFRARRMPWIIGGMAAAMLCSLAGFSDLVGTVYPIFGYCGFVFLGMLFLHWLHRRKELKD